MKLASVEVYGRDVLAAQLEQGWLIDLALAIRAVSPATEVSTLLSLIERGEEGLWLAREALHAATQKPACVQRIAEESVRWHAPVRKPGKIVCLALNNSANPARIIRGPRHPATFVKPASSLVGHGRAIECMPSYGRTHPEPELAVVIGKTARRVQPSNAQAYVFGYTIHNDITSATMRGEDTFNFRAIHPKPDAPGEVSYVDSWVSYPGRYKCADTFACMGPWLVTADEVPDPHGLTVECHHQGKLMMQDNTANLTHKVPDVIAFISSYMTLEPGDIVSMGTALRQGSEGVAVQNIDLNKLGGTISVTIQGLGTLVNPVQQV